MVEASAPELRELCAIRVQLPISNGRRQDHAVREGRGEIHILQTDPHDAHAVMAGHLEVWGVVLNEPKSRQTCGSETLDLKLSMPPDLKLHDNLLKRKNATRAMRTAQSASETRASDDTTSLLPVRLVEPTLDRVPVGLHDADANLENLLAHGTS